MTRLAVIAPGAPGRLDLEVVTTPGPHPDDLATARDADPLGGGLVGLHLRHAGPTLLSSPWAWLVGRLPRALASGSARAGRPRRPLGRRSDGAGSVALARCVAAGASAGLRLGAARLRRRPGRSLGWHVGRPAPRPAVPSLWFGRLAGVSMPLPVLRLAPGLRRVPELRACPCLGRAAAVGWCRSRPVPLRRRSCAGRSGRRLAAPSAAGAPPSCFGRLDHLGLVGRGHRDVHRLALEERSPLHDAVVLDPLREPGQQVAADLGMGQLPAPELDGDLEPIPLLEELDRAANPRVEVPGRDLGLEPNFLERHRALLALGFLLALGRLVLELAEIEKPDDRRSRHRGDLNEVVAAFLRECESLGRGHDPKLAPFLIHHPDLWDPDHLVDAQVSTDGFTPSSVRSCCPRSAGANMAPGPVAAGG